MHCIYAADAIFPNKKHCCSSREYTKSTCPHCIHFSETQRVNLWGISWEFLFHKGMGLLSYKDDIKLSSNELLAVFQIFRETDWNLNWILIYWLSYCFKGTTAELFGLENNICCYMQWMKESGYSKVSYFCISICLHELDTSFIHCVILWRQFL